MAQLTGFLLSSSYAMAVVGRGKEVVGLVTQAIEQLQAGNSKGATVLLSQLKSNASKLSDETQELLQQLPALQDYYKTEVEVGYIARLLLYA